MVREMARATRAGGTVALYVWDYADRMQLLRYFWDAAAIDARAASLDEGARFPLCSPDRLVGLLADEGRGRFDLSGRARCVRHVRQALHAVRRWAGSAPWICGDAF